MDWLIGAGYGLRVTSCGVRAEAAWLVGTPSTLRQAQCKQAQDKFFVFSLTIATILYKYMYICLCAYVLLFGSDIRLC